MTGPHVLVVGSATAARERIVESLTDVDDVGVESVAPGGRPARPDSVDVDAVFAVGESGLLALAEWPDGGDCAADGSAPPVFPIGIDADRYGIPVADADAAADALAAGGFGTVSHPVLAVDVAGDRAGTAISDVTLVTAEPARISEYAVGTPDGWLDTVRADGIVTATPLGSTGYARAAGGPQLAPGTGVVTVPISPYAMHARPWVLQPPMSLSVERDEAAVSLRLDGDDVGRVSAGERVEVRADGELPLVRPETIGGP